MSNFLAEARSDLKDLLTGYRVYEIRPEAINPTCIVIEGQDNYVTPSTVFGDWNVFLTLTCVVDYRTNKSVITEGDSLVTDVIERLRGHWSVQSVASQSIQFEDDGPFLYAPAINIYTTYSAAN